MEKVNNMKIFNNSLKWLDIELIAISGILYGVSIVQFYPKLITVHKLIYFALFLIVIYFPMAKMSKNIDERATSYKEMMNIICAKLGFIDVLFIFLASNLLGLIFSNLSLKFLLLNPYYSIFFASFLILIVIYRLKSK